MDGLYTTGEFARLCGVSKDTLFLYDQLGVLKPALVKRNGYRYYSIRQLFLFNQIISLNESGIALQDIQELFDDKGSDEYLEALRGALTHLRKKERHLAQSIGFLEQTIASLESIAGFSDEEGDPSFSNASLEHFGRRVFCRCTPPFDLGDPSEFTRKMNEAIHFMRDNADGARINLSFTMDHRAFEEGRFGEISFCSPCGEDAESAFVQPEGIYLTLTYRGNYTQLNAGFARLRAYLDAQHYAMHDSLIGEFQFLHQNKAKRLALPLAASKLTNVSDEERQILEQNERFEVALDIIMRIGIRVTLDA